MSEPWYRAAFGEHYLTVYRHRSAAAARDEAAFAVRVLGVSRGDRVLDLACGAGRHARALADLGCRVVGLDLSFALLSEARRLGGPAYARADMRHLPLGPGFDAVTLFFTSFGYFETDIEHAGVLASVAGCLNAGGRMLLDYLNRDRLVSTLVPESDEIVRGVRIRSSRWITSDGLRVEKRVKMEREGHEIADYTESVRLYSPEEVEGMLEEAGFRMLGRFGDLAGAAHSEASDRLVLVGEHRC